MNHRITIFSLLFTSLLISQLQIAATSLGDPNADDFKKNYQWSNSSYVGYAWSLNTGFSNPDTTSFKKAASGHTDDGTLGGTSYAGISLNRRVHNWLFLGFAYEIYNNFAYQNAHVIDTNSDTLPGQEVFGSKFTRSFTMIHQSAFCNAYLNFPQPYYLQRYNFLVNPLMGGGLGVGINKMTEFQTIGLTATAPHIQVTTIALAKLKNSLAWYVNLGISFQPKGTAANFGISYRYYVGGRFSSGNKFIFYDATNGGELLNLPAWTGTIRANQIKIFLDFDF